MRIVSPGNCYLSAETSIKKSSEIIFGQSGNSDTRVDYPGLQLILHRN